MLNNYEKQEILSRFPNIKLSYESSDHKKVFDYDLLMAIPEGKKCFAWFTIHNNKNVCIILEINNNLIQDIKIMNSCFNYELCFGTIFYGTVLINKGTPFFSIEDIYYYKGKNISSMTLLNKLNLYKTIFVNDIQQISYNNYFIIFGLPIINSNFSEMLRLIGELPYNILFIQYRYYNQNSNKPLNSIKYIKPKTNTFEKKVEIKNNFKKSVVFLVKPDIQNDIYHLYTDNGNTYYDIAYIPDYVTSVMMNNKFRNIKENKNLDALEESDDEEEFENVKLDKFVFLDKSYHMICIYNNKFKKWTPVRIVSNNQKTITSNELPLLEKNKY
jgi:hypothetical protein